ncbi:AraC family transcriptional regulator [Azospirillum soli]|uniref:AraC family transcriptional regulator n=1 Tax=Azospirillum soli TaxID=1304799 RepID=UPI001AE194A5|nr:AraC family transcriptional regulator [Azospirillum soli]MBP2315726.1 AraC-like DNA-binding protein [Azospirillum soli]
MIDDASRDTGHNAAPSTGQAQPGGTTPPHTPVHCRDLLTSLGRSRESFQLVTPTLPPDAAVLHGRFQLLPLRSGLSLHATDAVDVHDLTTQGVTTAGLTVALFLRGKADISLGSRRFLVSAGVAPTLFVLSRAEPDLFVRRGARGNWVRKVTINVPPDWLEDDRLCADGRLRRFGRTHGASASWTPSARQLQLAERMVGATPFGAPLEALYLESHALEIVADTLSRLADPDGADGSDGGLSCRDRARIRTVCDYLDAHSREEHNESPRLDDIARHAGMSVSALQRLFRAAHGTSVFDYYRSVRMDRARALLEQDRVSVTEASYAAGYSNPANFATAFKRRFGLSPKDARGRGS